MVILGSIIFLISYAQTIDKGLFDSVEKPLLEAIDNLPDSFHGMFYALTQFEGLTALFFWAAAAWYVVNKSVMFLNLLSGWLGRTLAKVVKASVQRGRPGAFIEQINLFNGKTFNGYSFPSGHAAISAA